VSRLPEHVAKMILAGYGVSIPKGILCVSPEGAEAAARQLGRRVYVKAQVPIGDRAAMGAVLLAASPAAAGELARGMLGATYAGRSCNEVLVEAEAESRESYYAAVRLRPRDATRELLFGRRGGTGFDPDSADLRLVMSPVARPFDIRDGLRRLGFTGPSMMQLTLCLMAIQQCALGWHAYVVEVNPLLITSDGPVAADAKVEGDDYSVALTPNPALVSNSFGGEREQRAAAFQARDHRGSLRFVQLVADGADAGPLIGTHSVGGGESLVVLDALASVGLRAANYCDTSGSPTADKVAFAAEMIAGQPQIRGYFFSTCIANQPLSVTAVGLVQGFRAARWSGPTVIRIAGNEEAEAKALLADWAACHPGPVQIFGREANEWDAAKAMSRLVLDGD